MKWNLWRPKDDQWTLTTYIVQINGDVPPKPMDQTFINRWFAGWFIDMVLPNGAYICTESFTLKYTGIKSVFVNELARYAVLKRNVHALWLLLLDKELRQTIRQRAYGEYYG